MQKESATKKNKTLRIISNVVLRLEVEQGHLKWMVTHLERKSKISRSLIYRYFGNSKAEIYKNAVQFFTKEFYGLDDSEDIGFSERLIRVRKYVLENPHVALFYLKTRTHQNVASAELAKIESLFQKKLKMHYPWLNQADIEILHCFIHGVVTSPFLPAQRSKEAALRIEALLLTGKQR